MSLELYRNDTDHPMELLCRQVPKSGKGEIDKNKFDEAQYITIPPCVWAGPDHEKTDALTMGNTDVAGNIETFQDEKESLKRSPVFPIGTPMVSIKRVWNTHMGHFGAMASWQMRGMGF